MGALLPTLNISAFIGDDTEEADRAHFDIFLFRHTLMRILGWRYGRQINGKDICGQRLTSSKRNPLTALKTGQKIAARELE